MCEICTAAQPTLKMAGQIRYQAFLPFSVLKNSKPRKMQRKAGATRRLPK